MERQVAALERLADALELERLASEHGAPAYDISPEAQADRQRWIDRLTR